MARTGRMERIYSIQIADIELAVYARGSITLHDIEMIRKAVDVMEETALINRELEAEAHLVCMQRDLETEGMSK